MENELNILVTIIMPTYNSMGTLKQTVNSVIGQSYTNFELIVVDDGSTDESYEWLLKIAKTDSRVIAVHQKNSGVSSARNLGISKAKGEYIAFIDSDDLYKADYIEKMLGLAIKYDAQLVMCGYIESVSSNRTILPFTFYPDYQHIGNDFVNIYRNRYFNIPWNKLFKKECIQSLFNPQIAIGEDLIFNLQNMKDCKGIVISDLCLYVYNTSNINSLKAKYHENVFEATLLMQNEIEQYMPNNRQFLLEAFWENYWRCIVQLALSKNKTYKEKKEIAQSWKKNKWGKEIDENLKFLVGTAPKVYSLKRYSILYTYIRISYFGISFKTCAKKYIFKKGK